jgi:hypothetical protein
MRIRLDRLLFLASIAVVLMAGAAFAQSAPVAPSAAAPWWAGFALSALPWLVGLVLGRHLLRVLGDWLRADGAKRGGALGAVERAAGAVADDADDVLSNNADAVKGLINKDTRVAAGQTLLKAAEAEAPKAAADAAKGALQNG